MMSLALYDYLEVELSFADKLHKSDFFDRKVLALANPDLHKLASKL